MSGVHPVPADFIAAQLDALLDDVRIDAAKIGMVASREVAEVIRDALARRRPRWVVLDPVMVAKSGDILVDDAGIRAVREVLVPLADLVTPNLPEAAVLLDTPAPHRPAPACWRWPRRCVSWAPGPPCSRAATCAARRAPTC